MYAPHLPEPWMIDELERLRHIRETGEQAGIPLYPPPPPPPPTRRPDAEESTGSRVIVIDLA